MHTHEAAPQVLRDTRSLELEKRSLLFDAPSVAGERPILSHDAMAGNHDRDRIPAVGRTRGTNGRRTARTLRERAVGDGGAKGNLLELQPDPALERSPD